MNIAVIAAILFACLVAVTLLGRRVSRYLPEDQLSADSKDAVKLAMGFIATMTAVLLGLLITSAKGNFDTEQSEVMQMAAKVAFLDRVLTLYGPEAADARLGLRDAITDGVRRMWPAKRSGPVQSAPNEQLGDAFYVAIHRLSPHGSASVAAASAVNPVRFQAAPDRTGLLARAYLLWLQPGRTGQRHDYSRLGRLRVFGCLRRFPNCGDGPPIWRSDPDSQRADDKRLEPPREVMRMKTLTKPVTSTN